MESYWGVINMSMVIAKQIDDNGHIDIFTLYHNYPKFCINGVNLLVTLNRVFNRDLKVTRIYKKSMEAPINIITAGGFDSYKLNLFDFMEKGGIPSGYYVEIIISNFIVRNDRGTKMIPIFPNEIKLDCDSGVGEIINKEIENIRKVAEAYEHIGKLHQHGLINIADDLREAIIRSEKGDYDGSIKFYRKVIEGLKNWVNEDLLKSANRTDSIKKYLGKAFHLLSNFGEHSGTEGLMDEALYSKEIALSATKYLMAKLEE